MKFKESEYLIKQIRLQCDKVGAKRLSATYEDIIGAVFLRESGTLEEVQ